MTESNIDLFLSKSPSYKNAKDIIFKLEKAGFEAWLAGGCVRDALLNMNVSDFDLASSALPSEVIEVFGADNCLRHGEKFGSIGLKYKEEVFEITSFRSDSSSSDSRHPDSIEFSSKEEDVRRRDFSINGMLYHPVRGLYDIVDGFEDLKKRVLKAIGNPDKRFKEDALRILRLYRFALNLDFSVEQKTMDFSISNRDLLKKISKERVNKEIVKTFNKPIDKKTLNKILLSHGFKETSLTQDLLNSSDNYIFNLAYLDNENSGSEINLLDFLFIKVEKKEFTFFQNLFNDFNSGNDKSAYHNICSHLLSRENGLVDLKNILKNLIRLDKKSDKFREILKHLESLNDKKLASHKLIKDNIKKRFSGSKISENLLREDLKFYFMMDF